MNRVFLATSAMIIAAAGARSQDIAQAGSQWHTDAQAQLEAIQNRQPETNRATNVLLFVSDGQGVATNYMNRLWTGQQAGGLGDDHVQPFEAFPNLPLVKTYNTNPQTADSAPTAGAMNTGVRQRFNLINPGEDAIKEDCATEAANAERAMIDGKAFADTVALTDESTHDADTLITVRADHELSIAMNSYCGRGTPIDGICYDISHNGMEQTGEPGLGSHGTAFTVVG